MPKLSRQPSEDPRLPEVRNLRERIMLTLAPIALMKTEPGAADEPEPTQQVRHSRKRVGNVGRWQAGVAAAGLGLSLASSTVSRPAKAEEPVSALTSNLDQEESVETPGWSREELDTMAETYRMISYERLNTSLWSYLSGMDIEEPVKQAIDRVLRQPDHMHYELKEDGLHVTLREQMDLQQRNFELVFDASAQGGGRLRRVIMPVTTPSGRQTVVSRDINTRAYDNWYESLKKLRAMQKAESDFLARLKRWKIDGGNLKMQLESPLTKGWIAKQLGPLETQLKGKLKKEDKKADLKPTTAYFKQLRKAKDKAKTAEDVVKFLEILHKLIDSNGLSMTPGMLPLMALLEANNDYKKNEPRPFYESAEILRGFREDLPLLIGDLIRLRQEQPEVWGNEYSEGNTEAFFEALDIGNLEVAENPNHPKQLVVRTPMIGVDPTTRKTIMGLTLDGRITQTLLEVPSPTADALGFHKITETMTPFNPDDTVERVRKTYGKKLQVPE